MLTSIAQLNYSASTSTNLFIAMTKQQSLESFLTVRLDRKTAEAFRAKAREFGGTSSVLREIVLAFNDNRLTVAVDPNRKTIFNL